MNQTQKKSKAERKKQFARIVCLVLAIALVGTSLLAALISQVHLH